MFENYEDCLNALEKHAVKDGYADFRLAREEFHEKTGVFEDGEPWFESRMRMFLEWYLLERVGSLGLSPIQSYLLENKGTLSESDFLQMTYMSVTLRSVFRAHKLNNKIVHLDELARGGQWMAKADGPLIGIEKDDIFQARIYMFRDEIMMGTSIVLHPKEARDDVENIIARSKASHMPAREIVDHLDKMRLKLHRYSNVRIQHVYKYPGDTRL